MEKTATLNPRDLYRQRFTRYERVRKIKLWQVLVDQFLQQFIQANATVVDVGAGNCEFINSIKAKHKIALDLNPDVKTHALPNVEVLLANSMQLVKLFSHRKVDVYFMSNLLEHLQSKEEVFRLLYEAFTTLAPRGRVLIMQPDISRVGHAYWDFFDHKVPLTKQSLVEVLETIGYKIQTLKAPFLPYSVKTRWLPLSPFLLALYLKLRPLQLIFGKQFFVCAEKPASA